MSILTREDSWQYKALAAFLALIILCLAIFGYINFDKILLAFGKVCHIGVLEQGEDYTIYKNNDGSRTLEMSVEPKSELSGIKEQQNEIYEYEIVNSDFNTQINNTYSNVEPIFKLSNNSSQVVVTPLCKFNLESAESQLNKYSNKLKSYKQLLFSSKDKIDIEYIPTESGIEENIILKEQLDIDTFKYSILTNGLRAEKVDNDILLYNEGELQFIVSAPWMKDAKDVYSYDIAIELEEVTENNEYIMTVIPDKVWLSSNERVYPITIDPSWSTSTANHIEDNETASDKNYYRSKDSGDLKVGAESDGAINRAYIRPLFHNFIPHNNIVIVSAQLNITRAGSATSTNELALYEPNSNWNVNNIYWGNQPGCGARYSNSQRTVGGAGVYVFDATAYAQDVFPGGNYSGTNKGVILRATNEGLRGRDKDFVSADRSTGRLKFTVTYNPMINVPAPSVTPHSHGANSESGYLDINWNTISGATKYYVAIFNGNEYQVKDVGNTTSWTTKNRRIWPTEAQINGGSYTLRMGGDGEELPQFPNKLYEKVNSSYSGNTNYYVKIIPANTSGYMTIPANCSAATIKLPDAIGASAPTVTISPSIWSKDTTHNISWSNIRDYDGTVFSTVGLDRVEYSIDTLTNWVNTGQTTGDFSNYVIDTTALSDGDHPLYVRAVDASGNVGEIGLGRLYIDRTGPDAPSITAPTNWLKDTIIPISWDSVGDANGLSRIEYSFDATNTWLPTGENTSPFTDYMLDISSLTDGNHTVIFRGVDVPENVGTETSAPLKIDREKPTIDTFSNNISSWTNTNFVEFTWTNVVDNFSGIEKLQLTTNGSTWMDVGVADTPYTMDFSAVSDGQYTCSLKAIDNAGNESDVKTTDVFIDRTYPDTEVTMPLNGETVGGIVEIWGKSVDANIKNTTVQITRNNASNEFIETIDILSDGNEYNNEFMGVVNTSSFDEGDILKINITSTDLADNTSSHEVSVTVGAPLAAIDPVLSISEPVNGVTVDEAFEKVEYTRDTSKTTGTLNSVSLFVDGAFFNEKTASDDVIFEALRYEEDTLHDIAIVGKNSDGDYEYANGFGRYINYSSTLRNTDGVESSNNVEFTTEGVTISAGKSQGEIIFINSILSSHDVAFNAIISALKPSGTDVTCQVSYDDGLNWNDISFDKDIMLLGVDKEIKIKLILTGDGSNTPTIKGVEIGGVKISQKHNIKIQFLNAPEDLKVTANSRNNLSLEWIQSLDPNIKYSVYRGASDGFELNTESLLASSLDANSYVDTTVVEGATYYYAVIETKEFGEAPPYISYRESEPAHISVTAYKTPVVETHKNSYTTIDSGDTSGENVVWGDPKEIAAAQNINDIYGGNWTVNNSQPAPIGSVELNQSMLGERKFCAAGFEPINFNSGNFFMVQNDASFAGLPGSSFNITRTYNAQSNEANGPFGNGWSWDYSIHLKIYNNGDVGMIMPDGHLSMYRLQPDGLYKPDSDEQMTLVRTDTEYIAQNSEETQYIFSSGGMLKSVVPKSGNFVNLVYDNNGYLHRIETKSGKLFNVVMDMKAHIVEIGLPDDKKVTYTYEGDNLMSVTTNKGTVRYAYDKENRMDQWYDENNVRQVFNVYDEEDRIICQWDGNENYYELQYFDDHTVTKDGNGYVKTIYFDAYGRTTKIVDSDNNEQSYEYNEFYLTTKYTDQLGRTESYDYDDRGNLIKKTTNDGRSLAYKYDANNNLVAKSDYMDNWTKYEYDDMANVTKTVYPDGSAYSYEYNENSKVTKIVYPLGYVEKFVYNGENLQEHINREGKRTKYFYDKSNNLVKTIDANNKQTIMQYNSRGNHTKTIMSDGTELNMQYDAVGNMVKLIDAKGQVTRYQYDALRNLIKLINPDNTLVRYEYDQNSNLIKTIYPDGTKVVNTYDPNNNLISVTNASGAKNEFKYNATGNIMSVVNPDSGTTNLIYDEKNGRLISTKGVNGELTKYVYDLNGNVIKVENPDRSSTKYTYDSMGRVATETLSNGAITTYEYDLHSQLAATIDAYGNKTTFEYNKLGKIACITNALGEKTTYRYDAVGNMVEQKDAEGNITTYEYENSTQLDKVVTPTGGVLDYEYDPNGQVSKIINPLKGIEEYTYNAMGRRVQLTSVLGAETKYEYDVMGRVLSETNAHGAKTTYEYDNEGNITKVVDPVGNKVLFEYDINSNLTLVQGEQGLRQEYTYDKQNNVTSYKDGEGYKKKYVYDKMGRLSKESDNTGKSVSYTYDSIGQVKTITNAEGEKTAFKYDLLGNLIKTTYADGTSERYVYNEVSRVVSQFDRKGMETKYEYDKVGNAVRVRYPGGKVYKYQYDGNGNVVKEINPEGGITKYKYDLAGNLLSTTDAMGNTTHLEYNQASMIEKVIDAKGNQSVHVEYNIIGNVISETDGLGNKTKYSYDAINRLTQVTDPLENITKYEYDKADNVVAFIDANNNATRYEYNTNGLLTKEINPLGQSNEFTYLADGLLQKVVKASGISTEYTYDKAGRMTEINHSDGTKVDYGYNEIGTITTMVDKNGATVYQYDDMQRLVSTTDSNDKTVSYEYDIYGRKIGITLPDGQTTNYEYDIMDRLVKVYNKDEVIAKYTYDKNSQLLKDIRNDIVTRYRYDEIGQITRLDISNPNERLMKFEYQYDKIGNIVEEKRKEGNVTSTRKYKYDSLNQLVSFTDDDYSETYAYDKVGNMLQKSIGEDTTTFKYNKANQLVKEILQDTAINYTYDLNGDLVSKSTGEKYTYDVQGNLTSIIGNGINQKFTYNGNGQRLSKTDDGDTTYYVNDLTVGFEQVLQTYDKSGDVINTYRYGVGRIDSIGKDNETYLYDGRGSVVGVVGKDDILTSYAYTAYGDLMPKSPKPKVFGYNAEDTDYKTGLQYLRARYYDVKTSRFIQQDEYKGDINEPLTLNRYIYVGNNPVMRVDPSGYGWISNAWNKVKSVTKKVVKAVGNGIKKVTKAVVTGAKKVYTAVKSKFQRVKTSVQKKYNETKQKVEKVYSEAKQYVAEKAEQVVDKGKEISRGIKHAVTSTSNFVQMAAEETFSFVGKLCDEAEEKLTELGDKVTDLAGKAWDYVKKPENLIKIAIIAGGVAITAVTCGAAGPIATIAIGAAVGGVTAVANKAVDDIYEDEERDLDLKEKWREYLGAGVSGLIMGGASAGVGGQVLGKGLSLLKGTGLMSGFGAVNSVIEQAIVTGEVDLEEAGKQGLLTGASFFASTAVAKLLGASACFVSGTVVATNLGYKNIENIKKGDYVLSENPETGEQEYNQVVDTYKHLKDTLVKLTIDGEEIITTEEHPFWIANQGWTCAADLDHGGRVKLSSGEYAIINGVEIIHLSTPVTVYNFEVENLHTYYVGEKSVLVHNDCSGKGKDSNAKYWDDVAEFNGNKVYKRGDLFDPEAVSSWKVRGKTVTGTNLERMASGRSPIGYDGKAINLHHLTQKQTGAIAEVSQSFHQSNYSTIHINTGELPSGINRAAFNAWRSKYWINRAKDLFD